MNKSDNFYYCKVDNYIESNNKSSVLLSLYCIVDRTDMNAFESFVVVNTQCRTENA